MAATVKVPAIGSVDRRWVYAGAAGAAGVLGYAWWTRAGAAPTDIEATEQGAYDALGFPLTGTDEYTPPTIVAGTGAGSGGVPAGTITTNGEWTQHAIEILTTYGVDPTPASSALGKFLAREPLSAAEADIVRQALGVAGYPPVGGPWSIKTAVPGAATAMPAPTGLTGVAQATAITWHWNPVTDAQGYDVELVEGVASVTERATVTATSWRPRKTLAPSRPYRINVYARNNAGQRGARATLVTHTAGTPSAGGMRITGLRVEGANYQDITWHWNPTAGAHGYSVELIAGISTVIRRATVTTPRYRAGGGLAPGRSYRIRVRARDSAGRLGPAASANGRTTRR